MPEGELTPKKITELKNMSMPMTTSPSMQLPLKHKKKQKQLIESYQQQNLNSRNIYKNDFHNSDLRSARKNTNIMNRYKTDESK